MYKFQKYNRLNRILRHGVNILNFDAGGHFQIALIEL
jgi:hypothetical protein